MSPVAQSFEQWRENVSTAFVPLDAVSTGPSSFEGTLVSSTLGALQLSEVTGREVDVRRTRATIRRSDPGLIKVGLQLTGRGTIVQNEREAVLNPGDFAVYDTSAPYELHFAGNFEMFVVMFPRRELRIDSRELTTVAARCIEGARGVGALVSPFLHTLRRNALDGTLPTTPMLEHAVLDLLGAALDDAAPHEAPGSTLLIEAKGLVESHLSDPSLSTASLAARLHISTRYLQKLFESDGRTVAGWIRSRRLDRCHRDLRDPRFAADSIGTICARHGLIDSSNFSKLFKETYGMSPREYRAG
ncbi:AraC family transcriptional regulator [Rhodococcus sp. 15-725-2-2b]|jgi:AraC-like DNA-binding protein|uniref:AraC-like ligand-binding domain-containing protein n=1 Tax=unclassified Rhodococcus (in: high G+C Gram-positive bacteria) TaxID=192944 RepID=UPI000B9B4510|nr:MULTISPECIES: helix-turn-helix domain-containing protein [unclassified Rhodococcus (in: high G+C Gram-positive bacteria)]OZC58055.1 AraC family transcriptional regulator [Rhodococcus sp. 06-470-2]OZC61709.1 AraC family transcriptional regulator [Rhodococcus sp. 06-469-3-2]OZD42978.1 AraC family transcriptional regulator [Rhodococcus sp. 06-1477-1A]OZE55067.1 AraC family transcriptional regulator [Rhodococcus sp. 05-2221-1B]OZE74054.1 AraC family transcriptional regulator [Rhodococcus sp. 15